MEPSIWEMQQAAQRRVQRMEQLSRRYTQTGNGAPFFDRRPAASAWAHRPPEVPVNPSRTPPLRGDLPPQKAEKHLDREQLFLLLLTLFLAKNGGSPTLILALLYLSF